MKYHTGLILSEAFCIFIFFYFLDSGLSVLNGLLFFSLRDIENRELVLPQYNCLDIFSYILRYTVILRLKVLYMKFINQRRLTEPGTLTYEKKLISQS